MSLYQMQMYFIRLLPNLEFTLPRDAPRICRSAAITMIPTVEGQREAGAALPLDVAILVK